MRIPKLVVLRADTRGIEAQLKRIATALEIAVGITPLAPEAQDSDRDMMVSVSSDADLIREEWNAAISEAEPIEDDRTGGNLSEAFRDLLRRGRKE